MQKGRIIVCGLLAAFGVSLAVLSCALPDIALYGLYIPAPPALTEWPWVVVPGWLFLAAAAAAPLIRPRPGMWLAPLAGAGLLALTNLPFLIGSMSEYALFILTNGFLLNLAGAALLVEALVARAGLKRVRAAGRGFLPRRRDRKTEPGYAQDTL